MLKNINFKCFLKYQYFVFFFIFLVDFNLFLDFLTFFLRFFKLLNLCYPNGARFASSIDLSSTFAIEMELL